jgi:gamma-glutamylcyclotransferase (GGCT)/AIG2-like uncharacterized protein YtfP
MANETTRYLFVYGTLMSGAHKALGRTQRMRLARESDSLGPASIAHACLYDLVRYPGAVAGGDRDDLVHGEAVLLSNPEQTFAWLDAYESDRYERVVRAARLAGGEAIETWVYLLRVTPARAKRIEDGRWIPR